MSSDLRDLLVGLNAVPEISRALLCRLACEPDAALWLAEAERDGAGTAQALGVPLRRGVRPQRWRAASIGKRASSEALS